jgi:hypothetical protein
MPPRGRYISRQRVAPPAQTTSLRPYRAKFPGWCLKCCEEIEVGQMVRWSPLDELRIHQVCPMTLEEWRAQQEATQV